MLRKEDCGSLGYTQKTERAARLLHPIKQPEDFVRDLRNKFVCSSATQKGADQQVGAYCAGGDHPSEKVQRLPRQIETEAGQKKQHEKNGANDH